MKCAFTLTHVCIPACWCALIMVTHNDLQAIGCLFPTSHNYRLFPFYNHSNNTTTTTTTGYCTVPVLKGSGFDSNPSSQLKTQFCAGHGYNFCFVFCALETDVARCSVRLTMFVRLLTCGSWSTVLPYDSLNDNLKQ
jgi:hypothetical protein